MKENAVKCTRILVTMSAAASAAALSLSGTAYAAPNPSGTGQPGASCQSEPSSPAGFNTAGFAHAEAVYAGSEGTASAMHSQSGSAVSQYDVACFQVSQH
jgi:hypothetical protein